MPQPNQPDKWGRNAWRPNQQSPLSEQAFSKGLAALDQEDFKLAEVNFAMAEHEDPRNARAIIFLLYSQLRRRPSLRQVDGLDQALKLGSNDTLVLRTAAKVCVIIDQSAKGLALLEKARAVNPQDSETQADLAASYLALRKRAECEKTLKEALRLDPSNKQALEVQRNFESIFFDAKSEAERNLRKLPDTPYSLAEKGTQAIAKGEVAKGFWQLREARRLNPQSFEAKVAFVAALRQRFPLYNRFYGLSNHAANYRIVTSFVLVFAIVRLGVLAALDVVLPLWARSALIGVEFVLAAMIGLLIWPIPIINFGLRYHPIGRQTLDKLGARENFAVAILIVSSVAALVLWPMMHAYILVLASLVNLLLLATVTVSASVSRSTGVRGVVLSMGAVAWIAVNAYAILSLLKIIG